MRERASRLRAIKKVIKSERIDNQEALLARLIAEGFSVTQATLSRDLKLLGVGKVPDGGGGYVYALPEEDRLRETTKSLGDDVVRGWISIDFSANIAVIRTLQGHANSVAYALDRTELPEILGTVAGDDTVIAVMREGVSRRDLLAALRDRFPGLELD